jgi:hypothetical protein
MDLLVTSALLVSHYQLKVIATSSNVVIDEHALVFGLRQFFLGFFQHAWVGARMSHITTNIGLDNA